ncbi:unnamed protein product [Linum trigynum]|uniref:Uncharacterized protein n=1 Tax=Linum trigynum TaxID=586398 RepID=A0AAV2CHH0_9ROSI
MPINRCLEKVIEERRREVKKGSLLCRQSNPPELEQDQPSKRNDARNAPLDMFSLLLTTFLMGILWSFINEHPGTFPHVWLSVLVA